MTGAATSSGEAIRVRTTERGLPVELFLSSEAVSLPPERLAREVLLRCEVSARRAQVLRREGLLARGVGGSVADALGLSTAGELAEVAARLAGTGDGDEVPSSWLRGR